MRKRVDLNKEERKISIEKRKELNKILKLLAQIVEGKVLKL